MTILVTGATGFVGRAVCRAAMAKHIPFIPACRTSPEYPLHPEVRYCAVGNIDGTTDWTRALQGCSTVIHLANVAHGKPSADYQTVNVEGTARLAQQALDAGIKRFVYVSSIGVNGNITSTGEAFDEYSPTSPESPYAQSKLEAEEALKTVAQKSAMEWVIVRPPMVYGANAPGNFRRLQQIIDSGMPLPFKNVRNQRSFISVENLAEALIACATNPNAGNHVFLISDGVDFSTPDFMCFVAQARQKKLRLFAVPPILIRAALLLLGKKNMAISLCNSLRVNTSKIYSTLGWQPLPPSLALHEVTT